MHEPNYTDYSLAELQDCLDHLNSEKYPERFRQLQREMALRREQGEAVSNPVLNELLAEDVPAGLALRALWCFLWRTGAAGLLCYALLQAMIRVNAILDILSPLAEGLLLTIFGVIFMTAAGVIVMSQVLAKRYQGYRIGLIRTADRAGRPLSSTARKNMPGDSPASQSQRNTP